MHDHSGDRKIFQRGVLRWKVAHYNADDSFRIVWLKIIGNYAFYTHKNTATIGLYALQESCAVVEG